MQPTPLRVSRRFTKAFFFLLCGATAAALTVSCQETGGQLSGRMYVPPGLQGTAQWGEVWLVRNYSGLRDRLAEHQRVLILSLINGETEFMRSERENILRVAEVKARLEALERGLMPTDVVMRPDRPSSFFTSMDSLLSSVHVNARQPTAAELRAIPGMKKALQDSAIVIRGRMQPSVNHLMKRRMDVKQSLMTEADALVERYRLASKPVRMDGAYSFGTVPSGDYGIYGRYVLLKWYVMNPAVVSRGTVRIDIPRLPGLITESRAVTSLDLAVNRIERM